MKLISVVVAVCFTACHTVFLMLTLGGTKAPQSLRKGGLIGRNIVKDQF